MLQCKRHFRSENESYHLQAQFIFPFRAVLSLVGVMLLLGTFADYILPCDVNGVLSPLKDVLECFSIYGNGKKILSTAEGGTDHISGLGGIRYHMTGLSMKEKVFIFTLSEHFRCCG